MTVLARIRAALTRRAARARADRALLRLAREACGNPQCPTCRALRNRAQDTTVHTLAADDPQRSPDWCHRHGCPSSQCPQPQQGGN